MTDYQKLEDLLETVEEVLPYAIEGASFFYPPLKALVPFLPLIKVAIEGVDVVAKATGSDTNRAMAEVIDHLTPGKPNSNPLTQQAIDFQDPPR